MLQKKKINHPGSACIEVVLDLVMFLIMNNLQACLWIELLSIKNLGYSAKCDIGESS